MSDLPAARRSDLVHGRLRADILEGRLAPGAAVPSERVLAEELGVNRHAVREALKRLEQAGLVRITQGGPTRVQDWRESAGLEVLLDLVEADDGPPPELLRAVLEMRESIGVDAARRCATRATVAQRAALAGAVERTVALMERLFRGISDDAELEAVLTGLDDEYAALWRIVVAGAHNVAYQLALTSLVGALEAHRHLAAQLRPRDAEGLTLLEAAVEARDQDAAERTARRLLEPDTRAFHH